MWEVWRKECRKGTNLYTTDWRICRFLLSSLSENWCTWVKNELLTYALFTKEPLQIWISAFRNWWKSARMLICRQGLRQQFAVWSQGSEEAFKREKVWVAWLKISTWSEWKNIFIGTLHVDVFLHEASRQLNSLFSKNGLQEMLVGNKTGQCKWVLICGLLRKLMYTPWQTTCNRGAYDNEQYCQQGSRGNHSSTRWNLEELQPRQDQKVLEYVFRGV